ncbi:hypothetical protein [Actinoplanes sp. NPDC051859]|uniref:hypothetical protein n=1 Tax=Actinoplanes sp. NPDC051859 TaxID=3363909 RepID=UPI00379AF7BE
MLRFGQARPLEVHIRVTVKGRTFECEFDVLVIDTHMAQDGRDKNKLPTASGCVFSIECKYYVSPLPKDEAVNYLGVRDQFPKMASLFITNSFSAKGQPVPQRP